MSEIPREEIQSDDDCGAWGDDTPFKSAMSVQFQWGTVKQKYGHSMAWFADYFRKKKEIQIFSLISCQFN